MPTRDLNVRLGLDPAEFQRGLNAATRQLDRFASRMESVGRDLTARLTLPLAGVGVAAVRAFADFEKLTKGLEAIATEADPAQKQLERLRKLALNPGISLEQAVAGSIRLQAVGQSAQDAERTLLQFSKAVALAGGTAADLDVVTRQLSQIQSKGRILSEDFLVIAERVPAIGLALETAFGSKNIEAIRESGVSATDFVKRLTEGIANTAAFQKVTGGLANAFDNFKQSITASLVELGKAIDRSLNLTKIFDRLSGFVSGLVERFKNLDPQTQKFVVFAGVAAAAVGPLLIALGSFVKVLALSSSGLTALLNPASLAVVGIAAFAAAAFKAYNESAEFRAQVDRLWREIQLLGEQLRPVVTQIQTLIGDLTQGRGIFQSFTSGITDLTQAIADLLSGVRALFSGGFSARNFKQVLGGFLDSTSLGRFAKFFGVDLSDKIQGVTRANQELVESLNPLSDAFEQVTGIIAPIAAPTTPTAPSAPTAPRLPAGGTGLRTPRPLIPELPALTGSAFGELAKQVDFANIALLKSRTAADSVGNSLTQASQSATAWSEQVAAGLIPLSIEAAIRADELNERLARQAETVQNIASFVGGSLQEAFGGFFDTILDGGQNALKSFGDILKKIVAQLLKAVATALALTAIFSIFSGGAGAAKGLLGIGSGTSLFGGLLKNLLPFASGGLVTGPVSALIGEGPGTSRANPEVVAPLDKLKSLLSDVGTGGSFIASARISGDDLLILLERAERNRAR